MSFQPINPKPYLQSLIGKQVIVKLKFNNIEYQGKLLSVDNYMNLLLDKDVKEIDNSKTGDDAITDLGDELFVRCNNVLWIGENLEESAIGEEQEKEKEKDADVEMK